MQGILETGCCCNKQIDSIRLRNRFIMVRWKQERETADKREYSMQTLCGWSYFCRYFKIAVGILSLARPSNERILIEHNWNVCWRYSNICILIPVAVYLQIPSNKWNYTKHAHRLDQSKTIMCRIIHKRMRTFSLATLYVQKCT